jgi:hypothetical protein
VLARVAMSNSEIQWRRRFKLPTRKFDGIRSAWAGGGDYRFTANGCRISRAVRRSGNARGECYSIPHGPGPPQRPHMPGAGDAPEDLAPSAPTAKTLRLRPVRVEPHLGHAGLSPPALLMDRTSFSNLVSHCSQVYS